MAKLERTMQMDFDTLLQKIESGILSGSMSATLEASSDFQDGNSRCSVRVFERYSYAGNNRLSMSVTMYQGESGDIHLSGITAGGSQAVLLKINTIGENAFLNKLEELLGSLS
jgi:hypothetical protein